MPAFSSAATRASPVSARPPTVSRSCDSSLPIVGFDTPDFSAKSSCDQPKSERAALISVRARRHHIRYGEGRARPREQSENWRGIDAVALGFMMEVGGSLQAAIDHPASDAWLAVVFFAVLGVASWQIGRAAKYILAGFSTHAPIRPPTFPHPRVTARK
jgi:hypothetical protein